MNTRATKIYGEQNRAIHMALSQLGLPYNDNRGLWETVMSDIAKRPVSSITRLTLAERNEFIMHLKRRGARVKKPFVPSGLGAWIKGDQDREVSTGGRRPLTVPPEKRPLVGKIRAQLLDLGAEWEYADGIARQMGIDVAVVEWCDIGQLYQIAQALAYEQKRQKRRQPCQKNV